MKILTTIKSDTLDAGPKAPLDVIKIIKENFDNVEEDTIVKGKNNYIIWSMKKLFQILRNIFYKDILIIQHPITQNIVFRLLPKKKTIILIHDLNCIRFNDNKKNNMELNNLKRFKYIIAHNKKMKEFLIDNGIDEKNIYINEIFDYICKENNSEESDNKDLRVIFAGNLAKSKFINQLDENKMDFILDMYGQGNNENFNNSKIQYKGVFQPDILPNEWSNDIGLVWDGGLDESDENIGMKKYTKYNNPHKISCYIASGIPVIVWKKSAIADFVINNNIGYTISNIYDINNIDFSDYKIKKENAIGIGKKLKK